MQCLVCYLITNCGFGDNSNFLDGMRDLWKVRYVGFWFLPQSVGGKETFLSEKSSEINNPCEWKTDGFIEVTLSTSHRPINMDQ